MTAAVLDHRWLYCEACGRVVGCIPAIDSMTCPWHYGQPTQRVVPDELQGVVSAAVALGGLAAGDEVMWGPSGRQHWTT